MRIEAIFQIKGRGTVLVCAPLTRPHMGSVLRHEDGRRWLITSIEQRGLWRAGDQVGLLIRPAAEGQAEPVEGDEVEMVEPLSLAARVDELEREVAELRARAADAEQPCPGSRGW